MNRWTTVGEAAAYEKGYTEGRADAIQQQWIPCSERLPKKDGQYYVTQLRYDVYDTKMTGAYVRETNCIWYSVCHKKWSVMANCKVVAWIEELPKPWEGDANG